MRNKRFLISTKTDMTLGDNLNGPCVIKVPEWISAPLGKYYLYFAHHMGRFIRMAYADHLSGPWHIRSGGVLQVEQTPFVHADLPSSSGVKYNYAHVASPNVHVDKANKCFVMYYHGLEPNGDQPTRVCFSKDGLSFGNHSAPLADAYFAGFTFERAIYGISWGGRLCRGEGWRGPFEYAPNAFSARMFGPNGEIPRHCGVQLEADLLSVFFTRIGDAPERILRSTCRLSSDWRDWRVSEPVEVMRPTEPWEGVDRPVQVSKIGMAAPMEHALRDPFLFEGHLFYACGGESGIGVVKI